jgi:hypothetical protein
MKQGIPMTVVCIAGMHRSGTSMVARLLNLAGLYLGPDVDIYNPASDNPDGFWENLHFVELNNHILEYYGGAWDIPPVMPDHWEKSQDLLTDRILAADLVARFGDHVHWGWKDPRNSLTINFWKNLLPDLKVVICVRNPLDVSRSLNQRGYSSNDFAFNLWRTYYDRLLSATSPRDRIVTHFDSFFANPRDELVRILDFINLTPPDSVLENALASIKASSRHSRTSVTDLLEHADSYELLDLYQKICGEAGPNYEAASGGKIFFSREDFDSYKNAQPTGLYKELIEKERETQLLKQKLFESGLHIAALDSELQNVKSGIIWLAGKYVVRGLMRAGELFARPFREIARRFNVVVHVGSNEGAPGLWRRLINRVGFKSFPDQKGGAGESDKFADLYLNFLSSALNAKTDEYIPIAQDDFEGKPPAKLIAFYLPQFHPIPENDEWWGRGFTEWTNVSKAVPQFVGHYQPHLPGELGFYDLRVSDVQRRQVELARKYGISGFCFYYYWFHGKRLLERPLEQFVNDPGIDFPFCICWANENWTRRWDGQENEILIGQEHSVEGDLQFIKDVSRLFEHKNYIRIDGRPVLIVYRANILPDPSGTARRWKEYCKSTGMAEPYLIAAQTFYFENPTKIEFDAAVQFPPHSKSQISINRHLKILNPDYDGNVINYADAWPIFGDFSRKIDYKLFNTVFPSWDNEPRKPGQGYTFAFSSPSEYQTWLTAAIKSTQEKHTGDERIVFINAWNEWAEGAHLEPDRRFGYAYLQATRDALHRFMGT